jgi:hypothetical protein
MDAAACKACFRATALGHPVGISNGRPYRDRFDCSSMSDIGIFRQVGAISPPGIGTLGDESGSQRLAVCRTRQDSHDLA